MIIKRMMTCLFLFMMVHEIRAQQMANDPAFQLKEGMRLEYEVNANGQIIPFSMSISSLNSDGLIWAYYLQDGSTGKFINSVTNLEKGNSFNWDEPVPGEERKLPDEQTIAMVSRGFLKELKAGKNAKYDGMEFVPKEIPKGSEINIDGRIIPATYAETTSGSTRIWVLDNDAYPILLKLEGNPAGIDLALKVVR